VRPVLLKLSGEVLGGTRGQGLDRDALGRIADEIATAAGEDLWLGIVVGAGNFLRGSTLSALGFPRQRSDFMGMVATVLNGLALEAALLARGIPTMVLSALPIAQVVEGFSEAALERARGRVVIFVGGTGNPFLTTDTASALRAAQMSARLLLKATKVDGVYSADPVKDPRAECFTRMTYREVLERRLQVMDLAAITLCMEQRIPIRVFNVQTPGNLARALRGENVGTIVTDERVDA
jgi:uridylate kinase